MRKISSFALTFAFVLPLAGCPGDDTGTTTDAMTTAPTTDAPTTDAPTTDEPTTDEPTTGPTTGVDTGSTTDPTAGDGGFCDLVCESAADCPLPDDYACTDGFCEYTGEIPACDPATCDDLMIGVCADVNSVSVCTTPCDDDSMCLAGFTECTGMDDAGNSICAPLPVEPCGGAAEGEPCDFGAGQSGVCTDGVCSCTDDTECGVMGQACHT